MSYEKIGVPEPYIIDDLGDLQHEYELYDSITSPSEPTYYPEVTEEKNDECSSQVIIIEL